MKYIQLVESSSFAKLSTFIPYDKRSRYVYNFGQLFFTNNVENMYVQGKREGKNGSHDLSSIFARYLREEDAKHKKPIPYFAVCDG